MHDPMVLALSIRRPFPRVRRNVTSTRFRFHGSHWYLGGAVLYWPSLIDVWHVEPGGHDAGRVCGYPKHGWSALLWLFRHHRHLSIRVVPWRNFRRWMWERCALCNGKSRRSHPVNHSLGMNSDATYHQHCADLVHCRSQLAEAREALTVLDVTTDQLVAAGMDWTKAWRITYRVQVAGEKTASV